MIQKFTRWFNEHALWRRQVIDVQNFYYFSWQALIAATFAMVGISRSTTLPPLIASLVLCVGSVFIYRRVTNRNLPHLRMAGYLISALIGVWAVFGDRNSKDIASTSMELLLAALPALLQNMKVQRRIFAAMTVTNLLSIGAILLANDLNAYGTFLIFIMAMAVTLNGTRMYFLSVNAGDSAERLTVNYFFNLVRTVPLGLLFGAMIFYWFPRMNELAIDLDLVGVKSRTGFSNEISLKGKGQIEESNRINIWISAKDMDWLANQASSLYLRGTTLDRFDGSTWRNTGVLSQLASQAPDLRPNKAHQRQQMELSFYREPTPVREVFTPYGLWHLEMPSRLNQDVFADANGNITLNRDESTRYQYDVRFSPATPNAVDGLTIPLGQYVESLKSLPATKRRFYELTATESALYKDVPDAIAGQPWFKGFGQKISAILPGPAQAVSVGMILRTTQRFFRQNFKSSLQVDFKGEDNLKDFLTIRNEGHCELFSTASALYLRSLGIPVRLVSGYLGGRYNFVSQMLEVPEKHAHVWLEVFMPGSGWIPFDPTPLIVQTASNSVLEENLGIVVNAMRFWFTRYVIDYDAKGQKELVMTVSRIDMSRLMDFRNLSWDGNTAELGLLTVILLISVWLLIRIITREDRLPDAPKYYRAAAKRLMAGGYKKEKSESYFAFHKRLIEEGLNPNLVTCMHQALERDLYSPKSLSRIEQRVVHKTLRRMPLKLRVRTHQQSGPLPQKARG